MSKSIWLLSAGAFALATPAFAQNVPGDLEEPSPVQESAETDPNVDVQPTDELLGPDSATPAIIVTAQGRQQVLQDVPISVNVVNAEAMELSGANDIRALNQLAPSLLVSSTGTEANGSARIRGIGTVGDNPGLESSVAVFIDGVYRSRTGIGLNELGEIERIEVLRGPQGTLFGRNASAGLINIITKRPNLREFEGNVEATYGNYDHVRLGGSVTGPVGDSGFGYRLDSIYVRRDGFYEDIVTGEDFNDRDRWFVRGQLLYEPSSDLEMRLIVDYTKRDESCCAAVYATEEIAPANAGLISLQNPIIPVLLDVAGVPFSTYFPSANDPYDRLVSTTPGRGYASDTEDYGASFHVDWRFGAASLSSITAYRHYENVGGSDVDYGLADILYFDNDGNSYRQFDTFTQELRLQGEAFGGVLDWLVGGYFAHEELEVGSSLRFGSDYGRFATCRLVGATLPPSLGQFYDPTTAGCFSPTGQALLRGQLAPIGIPSPFGPFGPTIADAFVRLDQVRNVGDTATTYFQTSQNFAFFTHNIITVTDNFDITLGLRYTNENKEFSADFNNNNVFCPAQQQALLPLLGIPSLAPLAGGLIALACQGNSTAQLNNVNLDDERDESEFTGTVIASWRPTDDWMFYASYSRGYKAGGFNLDRSALTAGPGSVIFPISDPRSGFSVANLQFDQEEVDAFEIGAKYESRHLLLSASIFRQEFTNFQLNTFNGTVFIVQNINACNLDLGGADRDTNPNTGACPADEVGAGVISQGVELEATIFPGPDLRFNVGFTYAATEYADDLVGDQSGAPLDPALRLLPGDNLSNAPEYVVTASGAWTPPIGNTGLSGLVYADTRMTGDYNTGSDLFPQKEQDAFILVNARVGVRGPEERWSLELWAQNLFDVGYSQVVFSTPFQAPQQIFSSFLAEPRTYGVTGRFRF